MKIQNIVTAVSSVLAAHEIGEVFSLLSFVSGRKPETSIQDGEGVKTIRDAFLSFDQFKIVLHRPTPEHPLPRLVCFVSGVEVDLAKFETELTAHAKEVMTQAAPSPEVLSLVESSFAELEQKKAQRVKQKADGDTFPTDGESDFLPA